MSYAIPRTVCQIQSWKRPVDCTTFETRTLSGGSKANENLIPEKVSSTERAPRPRDDLLEVPGKGAAPPLRYGGGTGRGPEPLRGERADPGPAGGDGGATLEVHSAQAHD